MGIRELKACELTLAQNANRIRVRRGAIGILERPNEVLLIRRASNIPKGGRWCFPGGHLERGETSRHAVIRELHEELGLIVQPVSRLGLIRVEDSGHVLAVWRVIQISGSLIAAPHEIEEIRWMSPPEVAQLPNGLPSNLLVLRMLANHHACRSGSPEPASEKVMATNPY